MGNQSLSKLLDTWQSHATKANQKSPLTIPIFQNDHIRLHALAEVYKLPLDEVIATLIHESLNELEARMPYIQGDKVIRVEDGENIYADAGPMPAYLEAQNRLRESTK